MSPEGGVRRLLLIDLADGREGPWPLDAVRDSLGAAEGVRISAGDPDELARILGNERGRGEGGLILTFGRISCGAGDWAPEATGRVADSSVPALATALRLLWTERHPEAYLFRNVAVVVGSCLAVNLPADEAMVAEAAGFLSRVVPHALEKIAGGDEECAR